MAHKWLLPGSDSNFVSIEKQKEIQQKKGLNFHDTEKLILDSGLIPYRYKKNRTDSAMQKRLFESTVFIAGCGATGQAIAQSLARLGAGNIVVADPDKFEETNLNRQIFSREKNIGLSKSEEAVCSIRDINSAVNVTAVKDYIESKDSINYLKNADIVVDALDNIESRLFLEKKCKEFNKLFIHSGISGHCGEVKVIYPGDDFLTKTYSGGKKIVEEKGNLISSVMVCAGIVSSVVLKLITCNFKRIDGYIFFDLESLDFIVEKV